MQIISNAVRNLINSPNIKDKIQIKFSISYLAEVNVHQNKVVEN